MPVDVNLKLALSEETDGPHCYVEIHLSGTAQPKHNLFSHLLKIFKIIVTKITESQLKVVQPD